MSTTYHITTLCDASGCKSRFVHEGHNVSGLIESAREKGWLIEFNHSHYLHFCGEGCKRKFLENCAEKEGVR